MGDLWLSPRVMSPARVVPGTHRQKGWRRGVGGHHADVFSYCDQGHLWSQKVRSQERDW